MIRTNENFDIHVIGGGLAGCEAAWAAASQGLRVALYEMRPHKMTGAHKTGKLGELVCSNSLGSNMVDRASGLLKQELRQYGSLLTHIAESTKIPAGGALAVDRELFSSEIETTIRNNEKITIFHEEITEIPEKCTVILASGPLTSDDLAESIAKLTGEQNLFFFDAIAPVVSYDSINFNIAFRASRYGRGETDEGDYINCPFSKQEYEIFYEALLNAERIELKSFEMILATDPQKSKNIFFEGCLPIEILAARGKESLTFGPLRPVGLTDPRTGRRPWAVLQLRQENKRGDQYNLVGFQTNLKYSEQKRVFRLIPGLENAEFERYGQMHRNTYLSTPGILNEDLSLIHHPLIYVAGQLAGVEGYMGNIGTGMAAGLFAAAKLQKKEPPFFPRETMIGSIIHEITHAEKKNFQPVKANFGIMPALENPARSKQERAKQYAERSIRTLESILKRQF